ncbi:hypothetical protein [Enterobacter hormaechei]|uniref:hypothetical protein n=1 Tax=Enterobacter hormaechei TaxID=158836 RepID=UPI001253FF5E|nr:hypothetical protein [Enterobacter hormaechei]EDK1561926.1 hypothetical protein [Salmonella enterica subsp. enterica serovar Newport]EKK9105955.1 hypothetical protein [Salmonella enterica]VAK79347.1 Uncharacterised protein [Enterobacter cloacae]
MGTSITTQVQILTDNGWEDVDDAIFTWYGEVTHRPFSEQNYGVFAFLADVRNYACLPVLSEPRGLPPVEKTTEEKDYFGWGTETTEWSAHEDNYSATWYLVSELLEFDYDTEFENRRNAASGDNPLPSGSGKRMTIREYLKPKYFEDLDILKRLGEPDKTRVVMSFAS